MAATDFDPSSGTSQIENFYVEGYTDMIRLQAQQLDNVLGPTVDRDTFRGYDHKIDLYGAVTMTERQQRWAASTFDEIPRERRTVRPRHWEYVELFDPRDALHTQRQLSPDSQFARAVLGSYYKQCDDLIVAAFDGDHLNDAGSAVTFATDGGSTVDQDFDADNNGFSVKKILEAYRILRFNDVSRMDPWHVAVSPIQIDQLLNSVDVGGGAYDPRITSGDYNALQPLMSGEVTTFAGMQFHVTTSIDQEADSAWDSSETGRYVYAYSQSSMMLVTGADFEINFDIDIQKGHSLQAAHYATMNATRLDGAGVVRIQCVDAVA